MFGNLTEKLEELRKDGSEEAMIEAGKRTGSTNTWKKIQELFNLTDEETWQLQKNNKKEQ